MVLLHGSVQIPSPNRGAVYEPLGWLLKGIIHEGAAGLQPKAIVVVSLALHTTSTLFLFATLLLLLPRLNKRFLTGGCDFGRVSTLCTFGIFFLGSDQMGKRHIFAHGVCK